MNLNLQKLQCYPVSNSLPRFRHSGFWVDRLERCQLERKVWLRGCGTPVCKARRRISERRCRNVPISCYGNEDVWNAPIEDPPYISYNDPNTGEPAPTYGVRPGIADPSYWGEDMGNIIRSSDAFTPPESSTLEPGNSREKGARIGRRRRGKAFMNAAQGDGFSDDEIAQGETGSVMKSSVSEFEEIDETEEAKGSELEEGEDEVEDTVESVAGSKEELALATFTAAETAVDALAEEGKPLENDELWWNWQKPPIDQTPWSAWQKRPGDSDTVMAAAMAETGQIKLFGDKPTVAEATLARARRRVFYNERIEEEERRKCELGALAYYKEWVKAWKKDTSKAAVQKHFEETGEPEGIQLLDMFEYQTLAEYRIMQGTDIRIQRDPLTMRMREDQIKQVWGGDPVYPTVNYEHDPDEIVDFRGANFHEPIPDIIEMLRENGRLITQEEIKELQALEKAQEIEMHD